MDDLTSQADAERAETSLDTSAMTPMMAQYLGIKQAHRDDMLFYRMGDFYELFFDDAVKASAALDIALTKRGKHDGNDIPMCGVPVHSHEAYLNRLIRKGFRVAICEQTEDPAEAKKRGAKSVVRREVMRIVTPGTITEDTLLESRRHNYLAALARAQGALAIAWLDISTGDFRTQAVADGDMGAVLARIDPGEVVAPDTLISNPEMASVWFDVEDRLTPLPGGRFDSENGRRRLETLFGVKTLDAFGAFSRAELAAAGALVDYVELTQKGKLPRLQPPTPLLEGAVMEIDSATRRNLELSVTMSGERQGSLLDAVDRTVTGGGARLLAARLAAPLTDPDAINRRLDLAEAFLLDGRARGTLRAQLKGVPEIARALSRLSIGRGGPRDMGSIRAGLIGAAAIQQALRNLSGLAVAADMPDIMQRLGGHDALIDELSRALVAEPPPAVADGGFIAKGYLARLDELTALRDESRRLIAALQKKIRRSNRHSGAQGAAQ